MLRSLLSAAVGGLVVAFAGWLLLLTGAIRTGDDDASPAPAPAPAESPRIAAATAAEPEPVRPTDDGDGPPSVNTIYDRAAPGVVFIRAGGRQEATQPFRLPGGEGEATGSGFVLDREGYVLTNAHVVEDAQRVRVRFQAGEAAPFVDARVVGSDPSTDLAVLKVDPDEADLRPLPLADSDRVDVGDAAIAIGNPFGFERTVTTGIVSALHRRIDAPNSFQIDDVIQTDASINPGNSGGPLLDAYGRVMGINAQIATGGARGSVGIGFAVPVNTAKEVVPEIKDGGTVERAFLGVSTVTVSEEVAEQLRLPERRGALVQQLARGGPAARAGLRAGNPGDLIVRVDGRPVVTSEDVSGAIEDRKPGDRVAVEVRRGDERERFEVTLGRRPDRPLGPAEPEGLTP